MAMRVGQRSWRAFRAAAMLLFTAALPGVAADFIVESGQLEVLLPPSGRGQKYDMSLANFGRPIYGGSLR